MEGRAPAADEAELPTREISSLRQAYGVTADFEAELGDAWRLIEPHIAGIVSSLLERQAATGGGTVTDQRVRQRVDYARGKLACPIDQAWIDRIVDEADRIARDNLEFSVVAASMLVAQMRIHTLFFELTQDPAKLQRLTRATQQLAMIEFEIIVSRLREIARARNQAALRDEAKAARAELGEAITSTTRASRDIARFTEQTAAELQALRAPATEVAGAAEQSALAMAQSAENAAGLIGAYERAREDALAATEVAGRADAIAVEGADNAARLAAHNDQIESMVTLIAEMAGQTRLLALNASIEAARAGERGRGFAVVAQEVRTLADRAADATSEITESVRHAQQASAVMANTNREILAIVAELLDRVRAVSATMEAQMATVGAILASIDETAVSSREIASLIAMISERVALLAGAAEEAGRQTAAAGEALQRIDDTVGQFMEGIG